MDRENYFILLELSIDPPENNTAKIEEAIAAKQKQWGQELNNPVKKANADRFLKLLKKEDDGIRAVMLDSSLRSKEAAAAKVIFDKKKGELRSKISLYASKGDEKLSDKDIKSILNSFAKYGFTKDYIVREYDKVRKENSSSEIDPNQILDSDKGSNIERMLRQLGSRGSNLYEFLRLPPSASCRQLRDAAEKEKSKILAKGDKNTSDSIVQNLCGLCITVFKDDASKKKYDNYIALMRYPDVNEAIDEMAKSNNKVIEPKMKEHIIDMLCTSYDISPSEASRYISRFIGFRGYREKDKSIVCGLCGTENPGGAEICSNCGKQLVIICPICETGNSNANKTCSKCGFEFAMMDRAMSLLKTARKLWMEKKADEAESTLKKAKLCWSNNPEILSLEAEISKFRSEYDRFIGGITSDISAKKFYSASLAISKAENMGYNIPADIGEKVRAAISFAEKELNRTGSLPAEEAFEILSGLSEKISDSEELTRQLSKYPPEAVSGFSASVRDNRAELSWDRTRSKGSVEYVLVRKEKTYPNNAEDGKVVYRGKELLYSDSGLESATVYCYAIFAVRAGIFSPAARLEQNVVIVPNVTDIRAVGGDGTAVLSWSGDPSVVKVFVGVYQGDSKPESENSYKDARCSRIDGMQVTGLSNGKRYWICVKAYRLVDGKEYCSSGAEICVIPEKPARPIGGLSVIYTNNVFRASWVSSEWNIVIFWSREDPCISAGTIYSYNDIAKKLTPVEFTPGSGNEAEFSISFVGECYVVVGQINAQSVVLNDPVYVSSVPPVTDLSYDLSTSGTELYVSFTWPAKINNSLLVYRRDDYPSGVDDPMAVSVECNKKQYQNNEGIVINNPVAGMYYAMVYTYVENGGRRVYSAPEKTIINNEPQREVYYTMKLKKGLFSKKKTLSVTVAAEGNFMFPQFCIMGKYKSVPLNKKDGDCICSSDCETEINGSRKYEFEVDFREGTKLKMFFVNDKHYKHYKILNDGENSF